MFERDHRPNVFRPHCPEGTLACPVLVHPGDSGRRCSRTTLVFQGNRLLAARRGAIPTAPEVVRGKQIGNPDRLPQSDPSQDVGPSGKSVSSIVSLNVSLTRRLRSKGRAGFSQIQIGLTPITLVIGFLQMIVFGWSVGIQTLLGVYLQTPVEEGGYGFTPERQAFCQSKPDISEEAGVC